MCVLPIMGPSGLEEAVNESKNGCVHVVVGEGWSGEGPVLQEGVSVLLLLIN